MRTGMAFGISLWAAAGWAQVSVVGTFKPGLEHGRLSASQAETARRVKASLVGGSMKFNKDKTFGVSLAGRIMIGRYSISGSTLTINVTEIVGKTAEQVKKMPQSERVARFRIEAGGKKLISLPEPAAGKPKLVWKRI
jgi:hypothetical protein